jgi:TRAP-type C4-dicarboxylate transport system substrate-binding protein
MNERPIQPKPKKPGFWDRLTTAIRDTLPKVWKPAEDQQVAARAEAAAQTEYRRLRREEQRISHKARMTKKRRMREAMAKRSRRINYGLV